MSHITHHTYYSFKLLCKWNKTSKVVIKLYSVGCQFKLDLGNSFSRIKSLGTRACACTFIKMNIPWRRDEIKVRTVEDGVAAVQAHFVLENFLALGAIGILRRYLNG